MKKAILFFLLSLILSSCFSETPMQFEPDFLKRYEFYLPPFDINHSYYDTSNRVHNITVGKYLRSGRFFVTGSYSFSKEGLIEQIQDESDGLLYTYNYFYTDQNLINKVESYILWDDGSERKKTNLEINITHKENSFDFEYYLNSTSELLSTFREVFTHSGDKTTVSIFDIDPNGNLSLSRLLKYEKKQLVEYSNYFNGELIQKITYEYSDGQLFQSLIHNFPQGNEQLIQTHYEYEEDILKRSYQTILQGNPDEITLEELSYTYTFDELGNWLQLNLLRNFYTGTGELKSTNEKTIIREIEYWEPLKDGRSILKSMTETR